MWLSRCYHRTQMDQWSSINVPTNCLLWCIQSQVQFPACLLPFFSSNAAVAHHATSSANGRHASSIASSASGRVSKRQPFLDPGAGKGRPLRSPQTPATGSRHDSMRYESAIRVKRTKKRKQTRGFCWAMLLARATCIGHQGAKVLWFVNCKSKMPSPKRPLQNAKSLVVLPITMLATAINPNPPTQSFLAQGSSNGPGTHQPTPEMQYAEKENLPCLQNFVHQTEIISIIMLQPLHSSPNSAT